VPRNRAEFSCSDSVDGTPKATERIALRAAHQQLRGLDAITVTRGLGKCGFNLPKTTKQPDQVTMRTALSNRDERRAGTVR